MKIKKITSLIISSAVSAAMLSCFPVFSEEAAETPAGEYTLEYEIFQNDKGDSYAAVTGYTGEPVNVEIPAEYEGYTVKEISSGAFKECETIESVVIPDCVETIDVHCFDSCSNLAEVTLPNGLTGIGQYAFRGCVNLKTIQFPVMLRKIGGSAFECSGISGDIVFPENLEEVVDYAFSQCSGIESVSLGDNVTNISSYAFSYCENLKSVKIGRNTKLIANYAFLKCPVLESIYIYGNPEVQYHAFGILDYDVVSDNITVYCSSASTVWEYCQNPLELTNEEDIVPINCQELFCRGDANLDTAFDTQDADAFKDFLLKKNPLYELSAAYSDMNGDGCYNVFDKIIMDRELAEPAA